MTAADQFSRPAKLSNAQTILYEIMMLRHARACLGKSRPSWTRADQCLHLEAFLLHFRNLIEFFGATPKYDDDLSIHRPADIWGAQLPGSDALERLTRPELFRKHEIDARPHSISKYLQHCTTQRLVEQIWNIEEMYDSLLSVIEEFESLVPAADRQHALEWRKTIDSTLPRVGSTCSTTF